MRVSTKLPPLTSWLTIDEASQWLSTDLNTKVSNADIFKLALDGVLTISVYFPNGVDAKFGKVVEYRGTRKLMVPGRDWSTNKVHGWELDAKLMPGDIEWGTFVTDLRIDNFGKNISLDEMQFLQLDDKVGFIDGIWDLAMIGAEILDIENELLGEISSYSCNRVNISGAFVRRGDVWASLQNLLKRAGSDDLFYPSESLRNFDHILVVKRNSLMNLKDTLCGNVPKVGRLPKLTSTQIAEIRKIHSERPEIQAEKLAIQYGVSDSLIRKKWN